MSDLKELVKQILNRDFSSIDKIIDKITDKNILSICLDPKYFIKLYHIPSRFTCDSDDEGDKYTILEELLKHKKINCILEIFKNSEINKKIAECTYIQSVSIYEKCIKCDLISDEDIVIICTYYVPVCIRRIDFDDDDYYGVYTKITSIFKYILDNRPYYAKYLVTIIHDEFSFWHYALLIDKDIYSEMLKELLISNIYEFNRIQKKILLEGSIIIYGKDICYIDTILLIMEMIEKYKMIRKDDIDYLIFICLKIVLCGVFPPEMYNQVFNDKTGDILRRNIYFILAFCYLNYFEDASEDILKDFCQIYTEYAEPRCNIDIGIREAINRAPNTIHLQKYAI